MKRSGQHSLSCLALATVLAGSQLSCGKRPPRNEPAPPVTAPPALTAEVESLLQRKMQAVTAMVSTPVMVEAVRESGRRTQGLTLRQIQDLDRKWMQTSGVDDFIRSFMTNSAAVLLRDFQKAHAELAEVFVADARGLNVCQTNKTSDYYQGDESWWVLAFNGGKGKTFHGGIEYDESSCTRAISLYVPVMDPERAMAIGVCKAVVNLDALGREL